jgi:putative toxin-antitoxin system antitoxin component (TIGR02293 family)
MIGDPSRTAALMGGKKVLGRAVESLGDMRAAVEAGLPKAVLKHVVGSLATEPRAQRTLMYRLVPEPTLRRRQRRLNLVESERTERLARVTALAQEVWGDDADARAFMTTPHPMLGGKTPAEHTVTDLGAREVEGILHALAFGLPA